MKKVIALIFSMVLLVSTIGCSTVEGLGKDIKKVGQHIEDAAE